MWGLELGYGLCVLIENICCLRFGGVQKANCQF